MPNKTTSVTRPYTVEQYMKTHTNLKISDNVLEDLIRTLDMLVKKITKLSEKHAKKEKRKTIMPMDLEKSTDEILRKGLLTVDELLQKIEPLSIIELSRLAKNIKKKADDLLKPAKSRKR